MKHFKCLALALLVGSLLSSLAVGGPIGDNLKKSSAKFLPLDEAELSTWARLQDGNILFVEPESTAIWKVEQDCSGYLYVMVRSGNAGKGMENLIPQILYEVKVNDNVIEMKTVDLPSKLVHMSEDWGVYVNWIKSSEPITLIKGSGLQIRCWAEWGLVLEIAVSEKDLAGSIKRVKASSAQSPESILSGQSGKPVVDLSVSPDKHLEEHTHHYFGPGNIEEDRSINLEKNSLVFTKQDTEAVWVAQEAVKGYLYVKVRAGSQEKPKELLKPQLLYRVKVNQTDVPMSVVKWEDKGESIASKADFPSGWIRSQQMVNLQPGSQLRILSSTANGIIFKTLVSPDALPIEK